MRNYPRSWRSRVIGGLLLVIAVAIGAQVIHGLLLPLIPVIIIAIVLVVVFGFMYR